MTSAVEEAARWLIRLDADTPPSREELQALREWLRRSPAHRKELEDLAALWGRMNVLTELAVPLRNCSHPTASAGPWSRRTAPLAASLAVVFALGWLLLTRMPARDSLLTSNGLYATEVGKQKTVMLADGSQVILNTNSRMKVDYGGGVRTVRLLQGEVLFTVAKDADRPFRVYAGTGRIEAVGTAFSVYLNGTDISVAVTEGRVSLARVPQQQGVAGAAPDLDEGRTESLGTLGAGHVAKIHGAVAGAPSGGSPLETLAVAPEALAQRLAWREGTLTFSGETLAEVVQEFARYTSVSIEIPDAAVRNMRVGGRFPVGETEAMLATLQVNFNLHVTWIGHDRVVITAADE